MSVLYFSYNSDLEYLIAFFIDLSNLYLEICSYSIYLKYGFKKNHIQIFDSVRNI